MFNSAQIKKTVCCTCCSGRLLANCGIEFQHRQCKLELGLDPDFIRQELLAREGANSNPVISPARGYLNKVRA